VQGADPEAVGHVLRLLARLGVDQVGRGDIGQDLRRSHLLDVERSRGVPVQVERPEPALPVQEGEGEHRSHPRGECRRSELRELLVARQVRHGHRLPGLVGQQAGALSQLGLQLLEQQRGRVGGGDVPGAMPGEIRVTPAPVTARTSTIRSTSVLRMAWIGKSVIIVRAKSARTDDSLSS
jgi:hypothetical protein